MNGLPQDLVFYIGLTSNYRDINSLCFTNKLWNEICTQDELWLLKLNKNYRIDNELAYWYLKTLPKLQNSLKELYLKYFTIRGDVAYGSERHETNIGNLFTTNFIGKTTSGNNKHS